MVRAPAPKREPQPCPGTISKHIRIDEELWKRLETAAGEIDTTANRLLAELAERWLETREWPQSEVQVQVARASIFTAQAIALDLIAAGRQKRVDQLLEHAASIVPGVAPEPPVTEEAAAVEERLQQGKLVTSLSHLLSPATGAASGVLPASSCRVDGFVAGDADRTRGRTVTFDAGDEQRAFVGRLDA